MCPVAWEHVACWDFVEVHVGGPGATMHGAQFFLFMWDCEYLRSNHVFAYLWLRRGRWAVTALSSLPEGGRKAACVASHKLDRVSTLFLSSKHKSCLTAGCQGNARAPHYCRQCSPAGRGREKLPVACQSWEEVAQNTPCGVCCSSTILLSPTC